MKNKTLNDFDVIYTTKEDEEVHLYGVNKTSVSLIDLKDEAINWVKYVWKKGPTDIGVHMFMKFHNITSEDLK